MPITQKPKRTQGNSDEPILPEQVVQTLINRGGSIANQEKEKADTPATTIRRPAGRPRKGESPYQEDTKREFVPVMLRLPTTLIEQIEKDIRSRSVRVPRHTWLLEAVAEKLERETAGEMEPARKQEF